MFKTDRKEREICWKCQNLLKRSQKWTWKDQKGLKILVNGLAWQFKKRGKSGKIWQKGQKGLKWLRRSPKISKRDKKLVQVMSKQAKID